MDEATSDALYRASQAGVPVDLWVRGICTIRPGVPGVSENIRVRSLLGRFLEHSRLFWFANDGSPSVGIGSADLMHRNLDRRVEVLVSITNPAHIGEIEELFKIAFDDGTASWQLQPDGTWIPHTTDANGEPLLDMQEYLINTTGRRRASEVASVPSVSTARSRKDTVPSARRPILAGGAVVTREDPLRGTEVVIIHRKRYDDWTLPKGKLDVVSRCRHVRCGKCVKRPESPSGSACRWTRSPMKPGAPASRKSITGAAWSWIPVRRAPDAEVDVVSWLPVRSPRSAYLLP